MVKLTFTKSAPNTSGSHDDIKDPWYARLSDWFWDLPGWIQGTGLVILGVHLLILEVAILFFGVVACVSVGVAGVGGWMIILIPLTITLAVFVFAGMGKCFSMAMDI